MLIFASGLIAGLTLDLLLARTLLAPPFRIWPTPAPGSWQSITFWSLFRGGMVATFITAALDWNSVALLDWTRFIPGLPLGPGRPLHHRLRLFQSRPRQYLLRRRRPRHRRALSLQPQPAIHRLDRRPDRSLHRRQLDPHHRPLLRHDLRLCADGAGRGRLAEAALWRALSRLLPRDRALPRCAWSALR